MRGLLLAISLLAVPWPQALAQSAGKPKVLILEATAYTSSVRETDSTPTSPPPGPGPAWGSWR